MLDSLDGLMSGLINGRLHSGAGFSTGGAKTRSNAPEQLQEVINLSCVRQSGRPSAVTVGMVLLVLQVATSSCDGF